MNTPQQLFRLFTFTLFLTGSALQAAEEINVDVVIFSGTPAGIAAALEAAREGASVLIVEPYQWVGGLMTNGLSHSDFRTFEGVTGSYLELTQRVQKHYIDTFGEASPEAIGNFRGTQAEPKVNRIIFEDWLAEFPSIHVRTSAKLKSVAVDAASKKLKSVIFNDKSGNDFTVNAANYIDASYEGDLMAAAGCQFAVGRESQEQYRESLAPEVADDQVQGYNFRVIVTDDPVNQIETKKPDGYNREDFIPLLKLIDTGVVDKPFCNNSGDPKALFKAHDPPLPHRKHDVNDVSRGAVRLSLPQINNAWPNGNQQARHKLFDEHLRHQVGLFYFVQNDAAVPESFRDLANKYKLCADEFVETNGIPDQLYVREARRLVGRYVFTQNDVKCAADDSRSQWQPDAIAMGDYGPNCHGTDHEGPRLGGKHSGEFYFKAPPYQIPLGVIQPMEFDNLLVPVACSASHVGFCAIRLEPIWMSLGQAAGVAARLATKKEIPACHVEAKAIRHELHTHRAATLYLSDVDEADPDFPAVQWLGALGAFHNEQTGDLPPCGTRGKNITGQYYEAYPNHAARLDEELTDKTLSRWEFYCIKLNLKPPYKQVKTRREFIRAVYEKHLQALDSKNKLLDN